MLLHLCTTLIWHRTTEPTSGCKKMKTNGVMNFWEWQILCSGTKWLPFIILTTVTVQQQLFKWIHQYTYKFQPNPVKNEIGED